MAYLKFLDSDAYIPCMVTPVGEHIVTLAFPGDAEVNTNGFDLFLDAKGEIDIGGTSYHGFQTIYRNDEITEAYNGYQLSNDGSVYVEPVVVIPEPEPLYEPTAEELAEQERQQAISILTDTIWNKKQELADTDYIIVKLYEYSLVGKECEEYDLDMLHSQRQSIRDEINHLEQELSVLLTVEEQEG